MVSPQSISNLAHDASLVEKRVVEILFIVIQEELLNNSLESLRFS